jgi:hypothetical protein
MTHAAFSCRALLMATVLLLAGLPGEAQTAGDEASALPAGARLRVTLADAQDGGRKMRLVGQLVAVSPDSLSVAAAPGQRRIPRKAIVRLERSTHPSRKGAGALIGFGVGFAAMFGLIAAETGGDCFQESFGRCLGVSAMLALPAAAAGAMVAQGERWREVPLRHEPAPAQRSSDDGLRLRLVPVAGRRTGLALVVTF